MNAHQACEAQSAYVPVTTCDDVPTKSNNPKDIAAQGKLPEDPDARKSIPMCTGLLDYFPDALAAVAACSKDGNDQHNPGEPLRWTREKSSDHADCIVRHLVDRGKLDARGVRHSARMAWRCLALLQLEIEESNERAD